MCDVVRRIGGRNSHPELHRVLANVAPIAGARVHRQGGAARIDRRSSLVGLWCEDGRNHMSGAYRRHVAPPRAGSARPHASHVGSNNAAGCRSIWTGVPSYLTTFERPVSPSSAAVSGNPIWERILGRPGSRDANDWRVCLGRPATRSLSGRHLSGLHHPSSKVLQALLRIFGRTKSTCSSSC